jgi:predicted neuraminidase
VIFNRVVLTMAFLVPGLTVVASDDALVDQLDGELIFPLHDQHNHAPGIAELSDGSLIVSWYRGSGERSADDVSVWGARRAAGATGWSDPFLMADTPDFPDCNTAMMTDAKGKLWLFWPVIVANSWESAITHYRVSSDPVGTECPDWDRSGIVLLKPDDFSKDAIRQLDLLLAALPRPLTEREQTEVDTIRERLSDKLFQRLGWQPRCKPTVLPSGRILLPLYTDTFSISIMAISDDGGATWFAGKPILGFGNIQPSVLRRKDGALVAYMRENGVTGRIRSSESHDDGVTWGVVTSISLPNPGSGVDALRLNSGRWIIVCNDTSDGRNSLAVAVSNDEGLSWNIARHLEQESSGSFHYPVVIQTRDERIHVVYSYFVDGGKSMKHVEFSEDWLE